MPDFRLVLTTSELTALSMVCFLERSDLELFIAVASLLFDCAASMMSLAFKFISFREFRCDDETKRVFLAFKFMSLLAFKFAALTLFTLSSNFIPLELA